MKQRTERSGTRWWRLIGVGLLTMALTGAAAPVVAEPARHEVLVIAKVSLDPKRRSTMATSSPWWIMSRNA